MKLSDVTRIHIVGAGGAGMSAIARILLERGKTVTGSDIKESRAVRSLREAGAVVHIGHAAQHVADAEAVIYSTAIRDTNPEIVAARERGIPVLHRSAVLGLLSDGRELVAVTGTHGKTTTTSLAAFLLELAGEEPGFLVGGELNEIGTNARSGAGRFFVLEADESDGSFLHVEPDIAIVTNIENDHLDHWGGMERLYASFLDFAKKARRAVIACADDPGARRLVDDLRSLGVRVVTYGLGGGADVRAVDVEATPEGTRFAVAADGRLAVSSRLRGAHNVRNLLAVYALAREVGVPDDAFVECARRFSGVVRRFQLVDEVGGVALIDDYAHHPTEIRATLAAAREAGYRRVVAVFQPHRYSRASLLVEEFANAFEDADVVVATEIYAAGEDPVPGASGKRLFERICERTGRKPLAYLPRIVDIPGYLARACRPGDAVVFLGAGDVNLVIRDTAEAIRETAARPA